MTLPVAVVVDVTGAGVIVHLADGPIRLRGRTAAGLWIGARCDRYGRDERPDELVRLPPGADALPPFLRRLGAA